MKWWKIKTFSLLATIVLVFNLGNTAIFAAKDGDNTEWEGLNPGVKEEQTDEGDLGMVVSAHPRASEVGAQVLRDGGNAVDAAVAMQFALNVVEPMMSGIGGGGFMMYYDAQTEDISIMNSRERAPDGATPDMFLEDKDNALTGDGKLLLGALDLKPEEGGTGEFHLGELEMKDLVTDEVIFEDDFSEGTETATEASEEKVDNEEDSEAADENADEPENESEASEAAEVIDEETDEADELGDADEEEQTIETNEDEEELEEPNAPQPKADSIAWDNDKYELDERGTTFTIDEDGGKIEFGDSLEGNKSSLGLVKSKMDEVEDSELYLKYKLDDPGEDKRMRLWVRADDFRPGSTFAKNGYGLEINSNTNKLKVIQSKDSKTTDIEEIDLPKTTDWQHLRLQVEDTNVKVRVWEEEEPEDWDIEKSVEGTPMPFQDRVRSGKSVGVPGTLKGLEEALSQWGSNHFSLSDLIQPAIGYAEDGVEVNWSVANAIENNADKLSKTAAKDVFLKDGQPLKEGDKLVQKDLAETFKRIAEEGSGAFYKGEIAEAIADEVQKQGGSMQPSDLENYVTSSETPVRGQYKGYEIVTMPPPSSGGLTMLQLLKMSELLNLTDYDVQSYEKYHFLVESMHLAYADRGKYMGDPTKVDIPEEGLLNEDYIKDRIATIDDTKANDDVEAGNPWEYQGDDREVDVTVEADDKEDGETTHFSVVDQWGNMVSYTTTIEQLFGSGIMVDGYGITLNNELTDFDAVPGGANEVSPGKRPLSSMTPTIVLKDGKPFMTVGSPGGTTIITSVTQTIMNVIGYDMELKDAIEQPRIYSNEFPNIRWEPGISDDMRAQVAEAGHKWESEAVDIGNVNSILIDRNEKTGDMKYIGAADSTRQGSAIGISTEEKLVDKEELQKKVDELKGLNLKESDYTAESWKTLQTALTDASDILDKDEATQEEVDTAIAALEDAYKALEKKGTEEKKSDKEKLDELLENIKKESLKQSEYTKASWDAFQKALDDAKTVLDDPDVSDDSIKDAFVKLQKAYDGLEKKNNQARTGENDEDTNSGISPEKKDRDGGKSALPATATSIFNWLLIGMLFLGTAVIFGILHKRRNTSS